MTFQASDQPAIPLLSVWSPPVLAPTKEISIDIGSRNLAVRVEQTEHYFDLTTASYNSRPPQAIVFDLVDLAAEKDNLDRQMLKMSQYFQANYYHLTQAKVVVVEQQRLIHNQITNATRNIRLMQHVFSYFQLVHPEVERVELTPMLKTSLASGAPRDMDRDERKDWAEAKAVELLTERGDLASVNVIAAAKKKDDLADTVVQLWMYRRWRTKQEQAGLDTSLVYQPGKRRPRPKKKTPKIA